jgi:hypothetical protein
VLLLFNFLFLPGLQYAPANIQGAPNIMKASEILDRARALADLENAQFITPTDEMNSLNEEWKDIYSALTETDFDPYLTEATIQVTSAMLTPSSKNNEYLVPLPADFYKGRYVDYQSQTQWQRMKKFNMNIKNFNLMEPQYRFRGGFLWIVGQTPQATPLQIRVGYYPPPPKVSVPAPEISYVESMSVAHKNSLKEVFYVNLTTSQNSNDIMLYLWQDPTNLHYNIYAEWTQLGSTFLLYDPAPPPTKSNIFYYKGYLYFLSGGDIWKGATDLQATVVPTQITAIGNILNFTIIDNLIYFNNGTQTYTADTSGGTVTLLYAFALTDICSIGVGSNFKLVGLTTTGNVIWAGGVIYSNTTHVVSDGTYLYVDDSVSEVHKLTVNSQLVVTLDVILHDDVQYLGNTANNYFSTIDEETLDVHAHSTFEDTEFADTLNIVAEMMSYRAAIDFKMKQNADAGALALRLEELKKRFKNVLKKDEGTPERIQNYYSDWYNQLR